MLPDDGTADEETESAVEEHNSPKTSAMRTILAIVVSVSVALSRASPVPDYPSAPSYAPPPPPPPPPTLPPAPYAAALPVERELPAPAPAPPVHLPTHYQPAPPVADPQPRAPEGSIQLPEGGRVLLTDDHLQYTQGFNDKGTKVSEQGRLISTNDGWEAVIVKEGSYSYISPEGIPITVNYIADENGFRVLSR